jgi:antitoxin component of RelBE/YafQ-DinJ toxin-antitoxin module
MKYKKEMVWSRVDVEVKKTVQRLADSMGVSTSEYVRALILKDLDGRSVFTIQLENSKTLVEAKQ